MTVPELFSELGTLPALLAFLLVIYSCWYIRKNRNVPPGPLGVPFLGYIPFLGRNPQDKFLSLGKNYGSIFKLYLGSHPTIVLNDYESIQTAFVGQGDIFSGRANGVVAQNILRGESGDQQGLGSKVGDAHKASRRFMMQAFKEMDTGNSKIQHYISEEIDCLVKIFAEKNGKPFAPFGTIFSSVSNVILRILFGRRFDHADPWFLEHLESLELNGVTLAQAGPWQAYAMLPYLPNFLCPMWGKIIQSTNTRKAFLVKEIAQHKRSYVETALRDYVDAFLQQQENEKSKGEGEPLLFADGELLQNLQILLITGSESTTATIQWALYFILQHPEIQSKIHREMDEFVGGGRPVLADDRATLRYLEATIRETQRLGTPVPFGALRTNVQETTLLGYRIPDHSYILPNYWAVNTDPKLWENPMIFNPDRFINLQGKVYEPPYFMPFSVGKRSCIAQGLAKLEMFLILANILQNFEIRLPKDYSLPPVSERTTGVTCRPPPFLLEAVSRRTA